MRERDIIQSCIIYVDKVQSCLKFRSTIFTFNLICTSININDNHGETVKFDLTRSNWRKYWNVLIANSLRETTLVVFYFLFIFIETLSLWF